MGKGCDILLNSPEHELDPGERQQVIRADAHIFEPHTTFVVALSLVLWNRFKNRVVDVKPRIAIVGLPHEGSKLFWQILETLGFHPNMPPEMKVFAMHQIPEATQFVVGIEHPKVNGVAHDIPLVTHTPEPAPARATTLQQTNPRVYIDDDGL